MKIGLAQYKFINNDIDFNISQIEKAVRMSFTSELIVPCVYAYNMLICKRKRKIYNDQL